MRVKFFISGIITLTLIFFFSPVFSQYKIKTVVIDAGHGGKDPGAVGKNTYEKKITLAIALKLGEYISEGYTDVKVIYTRDDDTFIELFRRSEIANENNADLFISVHVNANTNTKATGTSTYVMGLNRAQENIEVARLENKSILIEKDYKDNYEGYDPNSPETEIILNLVQSSYFEKSISLASLIQAQFKDRASRNDRGVKQAGLIVLWNCTMPSVLVETGFITNLDEEKYLMSENGQAIIASAIYRAFKEYKNNAENNEPGNNSENKLKTDNEYIFKVQIASSPNKIELKPYNFKGIKSVQYMKDGDKYIYTVGNDTNYEEILKLQKEIQKNYSDAFIIAFKNGKKISVDQARKGTND